MEDLANWFELILYTFIITICVVGVYQKYSTWINPFIFVNRIKQSFGLSKQVKFSQDLCDVCNQPDNTYIDDGCEGDGEDYEEDAALSEKDRIIRYYALALQEYQRLKDADKARKKGMNML